MISYFAFFKSSLSIQQLSDPDELSLAHKRRMINFASLSTHMLSGLEEDDIKEVSDIQALLEDDPTILLEDLPDVIPEDIIQHLNELEKESVPSSTSSQQAKWTKHFKDFLNRKKLNHDLENMSKKELSNGLRYYYSELRTSKGSFYSKSSLICIRAAIYRFSKPKLDQSI